jgi:hypothetical protein
MAELPFPIEQPPPALNLRVIKERTVSFFFFFGRFTGQKKHSGGAVIDSIKA